jgi:ATP/maltotriose-dependent transcriptional regulator MalT
MPQGTGLRSFVGALMNSIQERGRATILVLDDLHTIGDLPVLQATDYLIENRPRNLLVVCATRTDPAVSTARQRGRGQLVDLRFGDLRLTEAETDDPVREVWQLPLSAEAIQAVRERTEGWPVALRLLQLSMKAGASATLDAPRAEAADREVPIQNVNIALVPMGHEGFEVPHYDLHFFTITDAEVRANIC